MSVLLQIYAKAPIAGRVKTRLIDPLTAHQARDFYDASLRDVVRLAEGTGIRTMLIVDEGRSARGFFGREFPEAEIRNQTDGDLGERLANGFRAGFEDGATKVIAIGADSPTLPPKYIRSAVGALDRADIAIGPTMDGGYYLIGMTAGGWERSQKVLEGINWSTSSVFDDSLERAAKVGASVELCQPWYDIDEPDDFARLRLDATDDSAVGRWLVENPKI